MALKNASHPYLPTTLDLPHYVPNTLNAFHILGVFFVILSVLMGVTIHFAGNNKYTKPWTTKGKLCWFALCAFIHTVLEGYYSLFHKTFPGGTNFLDQLCKISYVDLKQTVQLNSYS